MYYICPTKSIDFICYVHKSLTFTGIRPKKSSKTAPDHAARCRVFTPSKLLPLYVL